MFLLFFLIEIARPRKAGLPLPVFRQPIFNFASTIFTVFLVFNVMTSIATNDTIAESLGFLSIIVMMSLASFYAQSRERSVYILYIIACVGLFSSIHGLVTYFVRGASSPLDSFFAWHNPAGGFFAPILIIFLTWLLTSRPLSLKGRFGWVGAILTASALVFTLSRGAWLGFILAFIVLVVLLSVKRAFNKSGAVTFSAIIVLAIILVVAIGGRSVLEPVYNRFVSFGATQDFSVEGRRNFYSGAVEIFKDTPLTGVGLGAFGYVFPRYQTDPRFYAKDPHSFYMRLIAEGGIPGLIVMHLIFICHIQLIIKWFKNRKSENAVITAGIIAALTAGLAHLAIDFDDTFPSILLNLGLMWVCALNLLAPTVTVEIPESNNADDEKKKKNPELWRNIILVLVCFVVIFHCGRMYLSESNYDIGKSYTNSNQWQLAEKNYRLALKVYPSNERALLEQSRAILFILDTAMRSDNRNKSDENILLEKALLATSKLKNLAPYRASGYFLSAMALIRSDDYQKHIDAIKDFESALEFDPVNSPEYHLNMARAYMSVGDYGRLVTTIDKFKQVYPFDRVEEYTRTRLEWSELPLIYEDMLLFESDTLRIQKDYPRLMQTLSRIMNLEKIRENILGDAYQPRKELLDDVEKQMDALENEISSSDDVGSIIEDMSKL